MDHQHATLHVLVVDDDLALLARAQDVLMDAGERVTICATVVALRRATRCCSTRAGACTWCMPT